ncbi:MAG: pyruvate formate-lyase-activating protein [Oscillospiraceae bacterium]|jgi:pyruvate formate lyase activating enzyme
MGEPVVGRIHSIETFGAVDGPGIRYVLFMQGCPLRCLYCHNPDSWDFGGGRLVTTEEIAEDIGDYYNFIKNGGVTVSGGEPLAQASFVADLLTRCKKMGLHTAVDTAGSVPILVSKEALDVCDLVILDIKALDDELCQELTGQPGLNTLQTLLYCEKIKKPVWIRHVLVPGLTLDFERLERLAKYLTGFSCIEKIELLPFHKMGEFKWEELKFDYKLYDTPVPTEVKVLRAKEIFKSKGLSIKL